MDTVRKLFALLTPKERVRTYFLLGMICLMALCDVIGVASIMPLITLLADPQIVSQNQHLSAAYEFFGFSSVDRFLMALGALVFAFLMFSVVFKVATTYAVLRFTHMRSYSIAQRLVHGYIRQPYDWFLNRHSADIGKTILAEVQQVVTGALIPFMQLLVHGAVAAALLALLLILSPEIALASMGLLGGVYVLIYTKLRSRLGRIGKKKIETNRERFAAVQEMFGGIKDVKVSGLEMSMLKRFQKPSRDYARYQAISQQAAQLPRYLLEGLVFGGILCIVFYLTKSAGGVQGALPMLSVFVFASYRLMPAVQQVYMQLSSLRFSGPALDTLYKDLQMVSTSKSELVEQRPDPLPLRQSIRLESVEYSYPKTSKAALSGVDLEIRARSTVGLVGTTGSGKTTTVDILLALLTPESGSLLVDGVSVSEKNARAWRANIGYVSQSIYLTDDSVAANIAFGVSPEDIDRNAVERAAKIANLHHFVIDEMPNGYDTRVGERGVRLSGGQRQRIGIARALYHDPEVLILDEATSALDNLTEQAVMEAIRNLGGRKTIIMVAHRLTTIQACDCIFMMDKGKVAAQGTYEELVESNGRFRAMAMGQSVSE